MHAYQHNVQILDLSASKNKFTNSDKWITIEMKNSEDPMDKIKQRHRALATLRFLDRNPGYRTNIEVLSDWLVHLALNGNKDQLVQQCRALENVGFLQLSEPGEVVILTLTEAGCDVARGMVFSDLVERPRPECPY